MILHPLKKELWKILALVLLISHSPFPVNADPQWTFHGPYGGPVNQFLAQPANPQVIFAAGYDAVYRSVNGGRQWSRMNIPATSLTFPSIRIHPNRPSEVLVAAESLWKSTNGGDTWNQATDFSFICNPSFDIAFQMHPADPNILYVANACDGAFLKSTDAGKTWKKSVTGLPLDKYVVDMAVSPLHPNRIYLLFEQSLYVSENQGASWKTALKLDVYNHLEKIGVDPKSDLVVAFGTNDFFESLNGGRTWQELPTVSCEDFCIQPGKTPVFFRIAWVGVSTLRAQVSIDLGRTWTSFPAFPVAGSYVNSIYSSPVSGTLYVGDYALGIYRFSPANHTWVRSTQGYAQRYVHAINVSPANINDVYLESTYPLKSSDRAMTWAPFQYYAIPHPIDPKLLAASVPGSGIAISTNGGANWALNPAIPFRYVGLVWNAQELRTLYAASSAGFAVTHDQGATWTYHNQGLANKKGPEMDASVSNPSIVYYSGGNNKTNRHYIVYKTEDAEHWKTCGSIPDGYIYDLKVDPFNPEIVFLSYRSSFIDPTFALYQSTDGCASWRNVSPTPDFASDILLSRYHRNWVFIAHAGTVSRSTDSGSTWSDLSSSGMTSTTNVLWLSEDPETIYAATDHGVYKGPIETSP